MHVRIILGDTGEKIFYVNRDAQNRPLMTVCVVVVVLIDACDSKHSVNPGIIFHANTQ